MTKRSRVDRVHINMFELAAKLAKEEGIPKVQAYRILAEKIKKKRVRVEPKNYFQV